MRQSQIAILGAPLDLGAGRRGVDMGPSALRLAGLNAKLESLGYAVEDLGNVSVAQPESTPTGPQNAKYLEQITHSCA
jgi:arginase